MPGWLIVLLVFAGIGGVAGVGAWRDRQHFTRLAATRGPVPFERFQERLDLTQADPALVRAIYDAIQASLPRMYGGSFPILPEDRWREDLHIDEDDIDMDLFKAITTEFDLSSTQADIDGNPFYGETDTIRGLVAFFSALPPAKSCSA